MSGSKKVMIVQPMAGKTIVEIADARNKAIDALESHGYEVVDTLFTADPCKGCPREGKVKVTPLHYLAHSLDRMSECDAVYLCKGWEDARGCLIECAAAVAYDLELIVEEDDER